MYEAHKSEGRLRGDVDVIIFGQNKSNLAQEKPVFSQSRPATVLINRHGCDVSFICALYDCVC